MSIEVRKYGRKNTKRAFRSENVAIDAKDFILSCPFRVISCAAEGMARPLKITLHGSK